MKTFKIFIFLGTFLYSIIHFSIFSNLKKNSPVIFSPFLDYYRISFVSTLISIAKVTTSMVKMITFVEKKKITKDDYYRISFVSTLISIAKVTYFDGEDDYLCREEKNN